jgi:hypothetical protein
LAARGTPIEGCIEDDHACDGWGYPVVKIGGRQWRVNRLVWFMWHGPIPEGMLVLHRCDNRKCRNIDHLFLGTHQDNMDDMVAKGRQARGSRQGSSKLTEHDVLAIRISPIGTRRLAKHLGVSRTTVQKVRQGKTWGWLESQHAEPQ